MTVRDTIADTVRLLDGFGFDIGNYRVSVYHALVVLTVAVAVTVTGRLSGIAIRRSFRRMHRLDATQQVLGEKLVSLAVWLLLVFMAVDVLGISMSALAVFSGAFGLAVGFGLQKTFGNLISGIILLMDRSIKPGDVISVGDGPARTVGQVNRIGIRAVSVITRDKIEYLIPNEHLMTSQVENWSFSSRDVRVKVPISVAYGSDLDLVERLLLTEARKLPRMLSNHEPAVWLLAFGENAVQFEIQLWIADPEEGLGNLRSDLLKAVWASFQANGIAIPFPQRELHIREWPRALPTGDALNPP
ncbi:MAG: mechanosensitive ion channel domain-containing protein [Novosphingobium sp.]